jgi:DNA-binding response OmpR family regulator
MPLTGHRILLVEDEIIVAIDIKSALHAAHGEVAGCAATVAKAMMLADTPGLSLAILDFHLRSENSLPVAAKLRELGVLFIFHTASKLPVLTEIWPRVPIILKPATPGSLVAALVSLMEKRQQADGPKAA